METARLMQSKRTNDGTKQNYRSKINIMTKWMKQHYPDAVNGSDDLIIPVVRECVVQFFGELSVKAAVMLEANHEEAGDLPTPMSVSAVRGFRSALVDRYRSQALKLDEQLDLELASILDGYEKSIGELKQRGRMSIYEGKRHLKWSGYGVIVRKFLMQVPGLTTNGQSWSTVVFGWSFCVIMWNLMSRSESIDNLMPGRPMEVCYGTLYNLRPKDKRRQHTAIFAAS